MISALDTNILLDLARPNPEFVDDAVELLDSLLLLTKSGS